MGNLLYPFEEKDEFLATTTRKQFSCPPGTTTAFTVVQATMEQLETLFLHHSLFFTVEEVWNIIKTLPTHCAPGIEGIGNCALNHCNCKSITHLYRIFDWRTRLCYFPCPWKHAEVIMLSKPGKDFLNPLNHRPIFFTKLAVQGLRTIPSLSQLQIHTLSKICPDQHGFKLSHSTSTQLPSVVDDIALNMNRRTNTTAVLLYVEKAFDKVWHLIKWSS